jgi:D-alanyl-D-alanine carboxypeptidase/D-alanyl-D-alanine-endopeptidase (penicillin-binding protein 4)
MGIRRWLLGVIWLAAVTVRMAGQGTAGAAPKDLAGLRLALAESLSGTKAPGSFWGVQVVSLDSGAVWFATNALRLFVPASNTKLFTVALALDRFGTGSVWETRILAGKRPGADGTLDGDLWLEAGGDPAPGGGELDLEALAPIRTVLMQQGVRSVRGRLVLRDEWFQSTPYGPGWNWDDLQEGYGSPVGGFVFGDNTCRLVVVGARVAGASPSIRTTPLDGVFEIRSMVRTVPTNRIASGVRVLRLPGSRVLEVDGEIGVGRSHVERLAVPDGSEWFGRALRQSLIAGGIPVTGEVIRSREEAPGVVLGTVPSSSMEELAALCLKPSNNTLAHQLWLQVGADVRRQPRSGEVRGTGDDSEAAARVLRRFAAGFGVGAEALVIEEGSGLSRKNLMTPDATVRLLRHMERHPAGRAYRAALPVGGVDGTLRNRFTQPPLRGVVQAKTGTLRHVNALAGHLTTAGGDRLVFAIYVNGFQSADPAASGRMEMDRLVELLGRYPGGGPK